MENPKDGNTLGEPELSLFYDYLIIKPYRWAYAITLFDIGLMGIILLLFFLDFSSDYQLLFWGSLILFILALATLVSLKASYREWMMHIYKAEIFYRFIFYVFALVLATLFIFVISATDSGAFSGQTTAYSILLLIGAILNLPLTYIHYRSYKIIRNDKLIKDTIFTDLRAIQIPSIRAGAAQGHDPPEALSRKSEDAQSNKSDKLSVGEPLPADAQRPEQIDIEFHADLGSKEDMNSNQGAGSHQQLNDP